MQLEASSIVIGVLTLPSRKGGVKVEAHLIRMLASLTATSDRTPRRPREREKTPSRHTPVPRNQC